MEEDKSIKFKKRIRFFFKAIVYTFILLLMLVAAFLILYVISNKIAEKKGENPPFALYTIISPSMEKTLNVYDVVFVKKTNTDSLKVDDIITFYSTNTYFGNTPITHRIVEIVETPEEGKMFRTKGDNNDIADEEKVIPNNIVGKVIFKVPGLGKVQFFLASKKGWILAILIPTLAIIAYDIYKILKLVMLKNKIKNLEEEDSNFK